MNFEIPLVHDILLPEKRLLVSDWAKECFIIPSRVSIDRRDTPYDPMRLPYQREILDTYGDLNVTKMTLMAPAQGGKTLPMHIMLGYTADCDAGPTLYVMPDELTARAIMRERLLPTFRRCPKLRRHFTGWKDDLTNVQMSLREMDVTVAWSNSPSKVASRAIYRLFLDETDKYPASTDREASPAALAIERVKNYLFSKVVQCSTPTNRAGYIWGQFQLSDKREYYVLCPLCGFYQVMRMVMVRKPNDVTDPEEVIRRQLAWYECEKCRGHWDNDMKNKAVLRGVWCPEGCAVNEKGQVIGDQKKTTHVGFHWNDLIVTFPTVTMSHCLAKFMEAKDSPDLSMLQNFVNSWMADIYEEKVSGPGIEISESLKEDYALGTVPKIGLVLVAGSDVQLHSIRYTIRGFGPQGESWLIDAAMVQTFEELANQTILRIIPGPSGGLYRVMLLSIDSKYRTEEVYAFCNRHMVRTVPVQGKSDPKETDAIFTRHIVDPGRYRHLKFQQTLERFDLNTGLLKDTIRRHQGTGDRETCLWHIPKDVPQEYLSQIFAEEKVRRYYQRKLQTVWRSKPGNPANHFGDCEVYTMGAARIVKVLGLPEIPVRTEQQKVSMEDRSSSFVTPDGRPFVVSDRGDY